MDDWEKQREAYAQVGRLVDKKDEDLVGRRIILGMGMRNGHQAIYRMEGRLFGQTYGEEPLFNRAIRVFTYLVRNNEYWAWLLKPGRNQWDPQYCSVRSVEEVIERFGSVEFAQVPLMFTRFPATGVCNAYTMWHVDNLRLLEPPFRVLACQLEGRFDWRLVEQDTVHFVNQFRVEDGDEPTV